jgi:hypothetical protein
MKNLPSLPVSDLVWPSAADGDLAGFFIGSIPLSGLTESGSLADGFFIQPLLTRTRFGYDSYVDRRSGDNGPTKLPAVLYRRQTPNDAWPQCSGDVVQVSPLISHIAWTKAHNDEYWVLKDPFIAAARERFVPIGGDPGEFTSIGLYLLDTTPRLAGAAYNYFLVCFSETTGEPECVFPAYLEVRE